jgi:predicted PP-loop superfamily ATPase
MLSGNRMIVPSIIAQTKKRKKSILALQRYLRMKYTIFISSTVLETIMDLQAETT